jgi:hypothetical protein
LQRILKRAWFYIFTQESRTLKLAHAEREKRSENQVVNLVKRIQKLIYVSLGSLLGGAGLVLRRNFGNFGKIVITAEVE